MLCLIGESFDGESVLVNGAVVNVRNRVSSDIWKKKEQSSSDPYRGTKFRCGSARLSLKNLWSKLARL